MPRPADAVTFNVKVDGLSKVYYNKGTGCGEEKKKKKKVRLLWQHKIHLKYTGDCQGDQALQTLPGSPFKV